MRLFPLRPQLIWNHFRDSSQSVGRLVLYIQIFTGALILVSVVSVESVSWFADQRLKNKLSKILIQEDHVAFLSARLAEISRIKEDFLLKSDLRQGSTRDLLSALNSELVHLSMNFRDRKSSSVEKELPSLILKEFDSANLRILRAQRVVSAALRENRVLTHNDGIALLRQYPLSDLRLVQKNLIDSNIDLNLLALEVESELEANHENHEFILILAVSVASAIAIFFSYRVFRSSIVIPLESVSSIATEFPIVDEHAVGGTADNVAALKGAVDVLSRPIHAAREINLLRQTMAALMSRLVTSFETLNVLSLTDPLCKVGNRRALELYGNKAWNQASRSRCSIGLLMIDVDYFKKFNDRYGHARGDQVLSVLSDVMVKASRRPLDDVFRYGGEEFLLLMYDVTADNFEGLCEDIRIGVEAIAIKHEGVESEKITISGGGVFIPNTRCISLNDSVVEADQELYRSKRLGRNCISIKRIGDSSESYSI